MCIFRVRQRLHISNQMNAQVRLTWGGVISPSNEFAARGRLGSKVSTIDFRRDN